MTTKFTLLDIAIVVSTLLLLSFAVFIIVCIVAAILFPVYTWIMT